MVTEPDHSDILNALDKLLVQVKKVSSEVYRQYEQELKVLLKQADDWLQWKVRPSGSTPSERQRGALHSWIVSARAYLDKADGILSNPSPTHTHLLNALDSIDSASGFIRRYDALMFGEFSECPNIPEAKEAIQATKKCLTSEHPSDTNECEMISVGENYTFHTHPQGIEQPSDADIETTRKLEKSYLCIGMVPQQKVMCWDTNGGNVLCQHPA